ncbi:hypothetical protein Bra5_PD00020 (plasmid) [Rhizobium phaseoli Brasil 5]|nr:hypothetical protein Bra5_PD00020 [Rhizobium phaseoli Brasil 5]
MDACLFYWNNVSSAIKDELSMGHAEKTRSSARGDIFGSAAFFSTAFRADHLLRSDRLGLPRWSKQNVRRLCGLQRGRPSDSWRVLPQEVFPIGLGVAAAERRWAVVTE